MSFGILVLAIATHTENDARRRCPRALRSERRPVAGQACRLDIPRDTTTLTPTAERVILLRAGDMRP